MKVETERINNYQHPVNTNLFEAMKKEIKDITTDHQEESNDKKITRKEAIRKAGYIAFSAATMIILLSNPLKAQADNTSPAPIGPF